MPSAVDYQRFGWRLVKQDSVVGWFCGPRRCHHVAPFNRINWRNRGRVSGLGVGSFLCDMRARHEPPLPAAIARPRQVAPTSLSHFEAAARQLHSPDSNSIALQAPFLFFAQNIAPRHYLAGTSGSTCVLSQLPPFASFLLAISPFEPEPLFTAKSAVPI